MKWLMLQDDIDRIEALELEAARRGDVVDMTAQATPKPIIRRGVARIDINGPMFKGRRPILEMLGVPHATYPGIIEQVNAAEKAGAKRINIYADSPGGQVSGLYEAMSVVRNAKAKTFIVGDGMVASAMYFLASQADFILAKNEAVEIGSVGVAMPVGGGKYITNSDSQKKHPDLSTDDGKAAAVEPLDDVYQLHIERIADGRDTTVENIKKNYGQGAVMTARTALSKGMIDGIMQSNQPAQPAAKIGARMDIATLKAEHPDTYAGIFALGEAAGSKKAADDAKSDETKRVMNHLKLAEMSGDMVKAQTDIENGVAADMSAMIHHQTAKAKRDELAARGAENPPDVDGGAGAADAGTSQAEATAIASLNAKYEGAMVI